MNGPIIQEQLAYFLTDDNTNKGRNPSVQMINGIHKIKDRKTAPILVSNYTNKHITFTKWEYIRQFEPTTIEDPPIGDTEASSPDGNETLTHSTNSITLKKMLAEQVHPDTFKPSHYTLPLHIQQKGWCTPTRIQVTVCSRWDFNWHYTPGQYENWHRGFTSCLPKMKYYQWVKEKIEKLLEANLICSSRSSWTAPTIVI